MKALAINHMLSGRNAHLMQLIGDGLQHIDFARSELITGALIPINTVNGMKAEADFFHFLRPIGSGDKRLAFHPDALRPLEPKPPRETLDDVEPMALPERNGERLPLLYG